MNATEVYALLNKKISNVTLAFSYKGSVASVSDLPDNAEIGDLYTVGGVQYVWDGTAWVNVKKATAGDVSYNSEETYQAGTVGAEVTALKEDLTLLSSITRNLFDGTISSANNFEYVDGKLKNTNTDTRDSFLCAVTIRNNTTSVSSDVTSFFSTTGKKFLTVTPTSDGNNLCFRHSGSVRNFSAVIPIAFEANKPYTISFDLESADIHTIGGLVLSKIQIEQNDKATEYTPHFTAKDAVCRADLIMTNDTLGKIKENTVNLFDGIYSSLNNFELVNQKLVNTNTDTRDYVIIVVSTRNGNTIVQSSTANQYTVTGRKAITITTTSSADNIMFRHTGSVRNFDAIIPFNVEANKQYTVSFNIDSNNPKAVGGVIISDIQIELGGRNTPYVPYVTAVDFVARANAESTNIEKSLNVLLMGDSIFGNDGEIASYLDKMCKSCVNGAVGGTRASVRSSGDFQYFDGVNIITALCTQTWTDQDAGAEALASEYPWITGRLAALKAVDMSNIDLLIMNWGTNDYTGGNSAEIITTAYNTIIDALQTAYPRLRILISTPIWRYFDTEADNLNGDNKTFYEGGPTLKDIVEAIEQLAKNKRISVLNAYQNLPLSYKTALTYYDANDKTHLNAFGNMVYAQLLHGKIRSIF